MRPGAVWIVIGVQAMQAVGIFLLLALVNGLASAFGGRPHPGAQVAQLLVPLGILFACYTLAKGLPVGWVGSLLTQLALLAYVAWESARFVAAYGTAYIAPNLGLALLVVAPSLAALLLLATPAVRGYARGGAGEGGREGG